MVASRRRTITGGYSHGALFVLELGGLLGNKIPSTRAVPPGATCYNGDQYATHPRSANVAAVLIATRALVCLCEK